MHDIGDKFNRYVKTHDGGCLEIRNVRVFMQILLALARYKYRSRLKKMDYEMMMALTLVPTENFYWEEENDNDLHYSPDGYAALKYFGFFYLSSMRYGNVARGSTKSAMLHQILDPDEEFFRTHDVPIGPRITGTDLLKQRHGLDINVYL